MLNGKIMNKLPISDTEIEFLANQVSLEMNDWLIIRLMDLRYGDSLRVIRRVDDLFHQQVKESLR